MLRSHVNFKLKCESSGIASVSLVTVNSAIAADSDLAAALTRKVQACERALVTRTCAIM